MADLADSTPAPGARLYLVPPPAPHPALERARLHRRLSLLVDRLITILDGLDGDPDLEDGADDEPSLSAAIPGVGWEHSQDRWLQGPDDDREVQCEDEGHDSDREPDPGI
ncbi:MAG: hypothetical protein K2X07_02790 [Caulobacteraceae bacterium]|nr:hypothetical protein [Caulobacteraceae bacterium]